MRSKNVLGAMAGQTSMVVIVMVMLVLVMGAGPLLHHKKIVAKRLGAEVALVRANTLAQGVAVEADGRRSLSRRTDEFTASHFPRALLSADPTPDADAFERAAIAQLRTHPQQPFQQFETREGAPHLRYAIADGAGGVLTLDLYVNDERAIIDRSFGQTFISASTIGYFLIALLTLGAFSLRYYLRSLAELPAHERRELVAAALEDKQRPRRNLLPWLVALCFVVFAIDLANVMDSVIAIGYILAVMLSLWSTRHWHASVTAAVGAMLLLMTPVITPYDANWWNYIETHSTSVFAILLAGFFGSANVRKAQAETRAMAEAARSRTETSELRSALQRAEAAETAHREMVERMRMANESAGISVWEWDLASDQIRISEGSPKLHRLGGQRLISSEEYASLAVHSEDAQGWRDFFRAAAAGALGDLVAKRYRCIHFDGSVHHIQAHARVLRDPAGRPSTILAVDWDVTHEELNKAEIARAAAELREAQERFQRAVSGAQDALFEFNLNTGEMWYSPQFRTMLGYGGDEADEQPLESLIHPEDGAKVGKAMSDHLQAGAPYDVEYRLRKKTGEWLWVRSRASAERDAEGQPLWLAGSIRDITDERAAREAMVRATAEAEAASRSKSTFLATMSHEIRTPMNGVIGMVGLLLDTPLDRAQREYAETIRASADSLLTILNDILDFSKIEAGKLDIETIELDLRSNVEDVGAMLAFQAAAKGLELVVDVRPEVPERVLGDPQRIRQCLLNLVGNAIKFTHSGEVVLEVCSVGRQNGRALVHFEVRDSGIGIAPDALDKLFQPFTQADSSTTRRFGGTGLGLSIVRKLVELMGGQVGAQSELGRGSAFWFTLPLEPAVADEHPAPRASVSAGRRVLLVDDNETNRRVLSGQMEHAGYETTTAARAQDALALLRTPGASYDIVVLDYHMPDMDGAMLGEEIVRSRDIAATRLVLLTSLDRAGDMKRFAEIGFSAYLTKPVRTRELLDCLERTLSHDAEDWHMHSQPIITRGTLIARETPRPQYSGRVLLVEDNLINQRVAHRFLERLGCEVDVVSDGAQAVDAWQRTQYAFILMDMQMPVMDGLEATQRIRELEYTSGAKHTPIIALTANAMMGTLERCLDAGMDDYLTKPLDISRLQDALDRFMAPNAARVETTTQSSVVTPAMPASGPALDEAFRARIDELAGGDLPFITDVLEAFVATGAEALTELRGARQLDSLEALSRAAHKLKGAAANLHLNALAEMARAIELDAKAGETRDWDAAIAAIAQELDRLGSAMHAAYGLGRRKAS